MGSFVKGWFSENCQFFYTCTCMTWSIQIARNKSHLCLMLAKIFCYTIVYVTHTSSWSAYTWWTALHTHCWLCVECRDFYIPRQLQRFYGRIQEAYYRILYSRKYWQELNLAVGSQIAFARIILADLNLAVWYGIAIRIIYASKRYWRIFLIWPWFGGHERRPPNRQI